MRAAVVFLILAIVSMPRTTWADEAREVLSLSTHDLLRSVEALPKRHPLDPERFVDAIVRYLEEEEVRAGRLFTLLPPTSPRIGEITQVAPPRFAFVARAHGRTLISLTNPSAAVADSEDRVLLQRWLVSDLLRGRGYSLTVYKEHTLDKDALRFLGVGTRLTLRPNIEFLGWRFNFEMYGAYHPDHEATAYVALVGTTIAPPVAPLPGTAGRALHPQGSIVPLRW
jgi:hypothetical protein